MREVGGWVREGGREGGREGRDNREEKDLFDRFETCFDEAPLRSQNTQNFLFALAVDEATLAPPPPGRRVEVCIMQPRHNCELTHSPNLKYLGADMHAKHSRCTSISSKAREHGI